MPRNTGKLKKNQANFTNKQSLNYKHPQQLDRSDLCSVQMNCGGGSNYFEMFGPNKTLSRIDLHFGYKYKSKELKFKYKWLRCLAKTKHFEVM